MNLRDISETVANVCFATSIVLNVDVVVVDSQLNTINSTYKYLGKYDMTIHDRSVIANCIRDKENKVVKHIDDNPGCRDCINRELCKIKGLVSIPIICEDVCVGAIEFMFIKPSFDFENDEKLNNIKKFLEYMAELLSSKLISVERYKDLEIANIKITNIIDNVDAGVVFLDNSNSVVFSNETFRKLFNTGDDIYDKQLYNYINHNDINSFLLNHKKIVDNLMVFNTPKYDFNAIVNCVTVNYNSESLGSLISVRRIDSSSFALNKVLQNSSNLTFDDFESEDIITSEVIKKAKEFAITDYPVLISGNQGVGRQSLASCMHNFSDRKNNSLVEYHCHFMPREEYLSKLFGIGDNFYAYGKLQLADKGTLVLHEVENLPINIQLDLLNLINNQTVHIENGFDLVMPDVRLICTTKVNLETKILKGEFIEELYYRLKVKRLNLSDFIERNFDERKLLVVSYTKNFTSYLNKNNVKFSEEAIEYLANINWENNLIGLKKFIEKTIYKTKKDIIEIKDFELDIEIDYNNEENEEILSIEQLEIREINKAFKIYSGEKKAVDMVAEKLGISRATLYRKIHNYGIKLK
jgi:DNA-binding NtrC family response regulator